MTKEQVYMPMLEKYILSVQKYYKKVNDFPGVFLPMIDEKYEKSSIKYFYVGRDTEQWIDFNDMIDFYRNCNLIGYINKNDSWFKEPPGMIKQSGNGAGSFFTMVIRLHIYLNTGIMVNVNELTDDQKELLKEVGWGNVNSIVKKETLIKLEIWNQCKNYYWDIKEKSYIFDNLKFIIDIYNPDYIFIFNWADDATEERILDGLDYNRISDYVTEGFLVPYSSKKYKAKIIWCPHPNRLGRLKTNINKMIGLIDKAIHSI
jgi:hypothetical protein